ncbi:hypothetical protein [Streptomyces sp. P17]|uniref:hypothetical protein n=1 Tax=Streptomyces sp. P17 TaxID=3074716 RepID=UPI0028F44896|nr:hypothetical protein [Streptomyces sp. P17]MDT9697374.1 hypothetical protein [Streptomyces sp. P17]
MLISRGRLRAEEIDDRELAASLANEALLEIRLLVTRTKTRPEEFPPDEAIDRINDLVGFSREMLAVSRPHRWRPSRGTPSRREQALSERPMSYRWNTSGPERRAWILRHVDRAGLRWTPPPPLPTPRKGVPALSLRQRLGLLASWPVKTPPNRQPLPHHARVLKALDSEALISLYETRGQERHGAWLRMHLDSDATHFLFPDPADYSWPDPDAGRDWWECRVLLRMADGEQVNGLLAVAPETFAALPSTVPRLRQHQLAYTARATERDSYLWGRDHKSDCSPETCGYVAIEDTPAS